MFTSAANLVVQNGGGNASHLSCGSVVGSVGALQMKNLSTSLIKCQEIIHTQCDHKQLPAVNKTFITGHIIAEFTFNS